MIDDLIETLLMLVGNETINLSMDNRFAFEHLIVQISRIKYSVRWHKYNRECSCQPEWSIKTLLTDKELKDFLEREKVLDPIIELLENPINKNKTVFDKEGEE